jgi:type IV secretion system protein VirB3
MILGVPYIPFLVGAGGPLLLAMYLSLYILLAIPVIVFIMRMLAKRDEMIFRLIGLNLVFRFLPRNVVNYSGSWVFSSNRDGAKRRLMRGYDD